MKFLDAINKAYEQAHVYGENPKREEDWRTKDDVAGDLVAFNLKPAENWETSLMECGL